MSFLKLDKNILGSSVWHGGTAVELKVWIYLLLHADSDDGWVDQTLPAIAAGCDITEKRCEAILQKFAGPDPRSRSTAYEGRRIVIHTDPEWCIELLNWAKYAKKDHTAAARKAKQRARLATSTTPDDAAA